MFQDWERFSKVKRQGRHQQCPTIGNSSAMSEIKICLSNVMRLGSAQHCNKTGYASAIY